MARHGLVGALENSREWLKTHAERVRKALPGRPIEPKTRAICRMFLDWCRDNNVDPKKPVENKCLAEISPKLYPEEWEDPKEKRTTIQERVRSRIEAARESLWWEFWEYELFFRSSNGCLYTWKQNRANLIRGNQDGPQRTTQHPH
jgi:hypothetical protein